MRLIDINYTDPTSLSETLSLLDEFGDRMKILAGGQSLLPMLNTGMAYPEALVDINHVKDLHFIINNEHGFTVGAIIRQRELEQFPSIAEINPLLAEVLPLIGHFQIRNRGTVCGSLAQANPAAELPAVAMTVSASLTLQQCGMVRTVAAEDFFVGIQETCIRSNELLTQVTFPVWDPTDGWAIEECSRRRGDYALVGVIALISPDIRHRVCVKARITIFGLGKKSQRVHEVEALLEGTSFSLTLLDAAVKLIKASISAEGNVHGSAEYQLHVAGILIKRVLVRAAVRAGLSIEGLHGS